MRDTNLAPANGYKNSARSKAGWLVIVSLAAGLILAACGDNTNTAATAAVVAAALSLIHI